MHLHILGICGTFMGGLAAIGRECGHTVPGCDANVYPPMSEQLAALGIELIQGYSEEQLALKPDVFVIGNVITRGNPLMEAILDAGAPYVSGPQWLAEQVLARHHVLAVAGTHGKTTTTSMLAWILECAGRRPGFLIGGVAHDFGISARLGEQASTRPLFVIEADEYDTAFFDKRSKFVHYRPRTLVLNNLEWDHADIFPDVAAIQRQFHHVIRTVPRSGRVISNATDPRLKEALALGCWSEQEAFGSEQGWHLTADGEVAFGGERFGPLELAMPGEYNRHNALAAIAAARHVGVDPKTAIEALARFRGVRRRQELRGEAAGVRVYDDFAHHPTAMAVTIAGMKARLSPGERLIAVFEPRSNTMKQGAMRAALPGALAEADLVFAYAGGVEWDVGAALAPLGTRAEVSRSIEALAADIARIAQAGDHVLIMSNGSFGGLHEKLLARLQASETAANSKPRIKL
ncbi:MAG: UDP-N-acetylmuramate:L-alanyl-gamma-D-glutamyl-meso-diaminopimelate ligase [Casimicrobiaceae bacterium]|nr:UDP-N-acetylmuramate:L-alanyl-gamma-D-glutamyl-meso-diaminopimelate ligase [Casimicrobiaceae bacterium]